MVMSTAATAWDSTSHGDIPSRSGTRCGHASGHSEFRSGDIPGSPGTHHSDVAGHYGTTFRMSAAAQAPARVMSEADPAARSRVRAPRARALVMLIWPRLPAMKTSHAALAPDLVMYETTPAPTMVMSEAAGRHPVW